MALRNDAALAVAAGISESSLAAARTLYNALMLAPRTRADKVATLLRFSSGSGLPASVAEALVGAGAVTQFVDLNPIYGLGDKRLVALVKALALVTSDETAMLQAEIAAPLDRDAARAGQARAEAARDAALSAQQRAEAGRDAARAAQATATADRDAAKVAQASAETARDAAEAAQQKAEADRDAATAAEHQAETDRDAAKTALQQAEADRDAALAALAAAQASPTGPSLTATTAARKATLSVASLAQSAGEQVGHSQTRLKDERRPVKLTNLSLTLRGPAGLDEEEKIGLRIGTEDAPAPGAVSELRLAYAPASTGPALGGAPGQVPDVGGYTEALARRKLEGRGYGVALRGTAAAGPEERGRVLRQRPAAGTALEAGETVELHLGQ